MQNYTECETSLVVSSRCSCSSSSGGGGSSRGGSGSSGGSSHNKWKCQWTTISRNWKEKSSVKNIL